MANLLDYSFDELETLILGLKEPKFRAKQVFSEYYKKLNFEDITNIPNSLKIKLLEAFKDAPIEIYGEFESKIDDTKKFLYKLHDDNLIEGVLMSYNHGHTLCVSTQVGCRMGCSFCASTKGGLIRNLSAGEILGQVLAVNKKFGGGLKDNRFITNVVLMGSGEPLDNFDSTMKFLNLVTDERGINISARNISLSTCGIVPKIKEFADMDMGVNLSISLHSAEQSVRDEIMPISKKYSVKEVVDAGRYYFSKTGRRVIFEYAVIAGVNIAEGAAKQLADTLRGFPCHVNIILINSIKNGTFLPPNKKQAYSFADDLERFGVSASLRRQMGADIDGACGQLRQRVLGESERA